MFTVHNLGYQGIFWNHDLPLTGLGWELFTPQGVEFYGKFNVLKAGLVFSDILTTVSDRITSYNVCYTKLLRVLVGSAHRRLLPAAFLLGGTFLMAADILARTASPSGEIPIGAVTALSGAPFFLYLLRRNGGKP